MLGTLSLVEYVDDQKNANVLFASDNYRDPALPYLYSFRVLVIAKKPIAAFEPLNLAFSEPGYAAYMNKQIEDLLSNPEKLAKMRGLSIGRPAQDIIRHRPRRPRAIHVRYTRQRWDSYRSLHWSILVCESINFWR